MPGKKLVTVELETSEGSFYRFPDVGDDAVMLVLSDMALSPSRSKVMFSNVSGAYLEVPLRILTIVRVNGVERWRRP